MTACLICSKPAVDAPGEFLELCEPHSAKWVASPERARATEDVGVATSSLGSRIDLVVANGVRVMVRNAVAFIDRMRAESKP